ncbi:probable RNA-binding protein 19 [Anoplophora glabripennis]|uniref:probable RNA-binding protein 19 n=1 Tax=Anoplophora glabripennis TaxID=217634 RepID=UPI0008754693|nr:probable RNA-binding protein 19 [Anoplophora glabripennis]
MSRLIVKNLPKNVTEEALRELFGQKGTVTDVQLKYTPEGKFRRFGFIGYQNESEAEEAIASLNNTFLKTSKISVENCTVLGDEKKPKAWSKYAPDSKAFKKAHKIDNIPEVEVKEIPNKKQEKNETVQLLERYKDDATFEEFLQVHAPKEVEKLHNLGNSSENEDSAIDSGEGNESDHSEKEADEQEINKFANEQISDLEYMKKLMKTTGDVPERKPRQKMEKKVKEKINLFTVKLKDLPYNTRKKDIKKFFKPITPYSIRIPRNVHGFAYVGFKTEKLFNKALIKDRSFINGKRISVIKYITNTESGKEENEKNNNPLKSKWKNQEEALKNEENIAESGKIFIRNLAYTTTEEDIEGLFSKYGPLTEVNLPVDSATRKMKGFGTITFLMPEHAVKAYSELDGTILHGRMVHLLPGKSKDTTEENNLEESSNFKKKKSAKQKAEAGSSHNWNSLFLGHDAVADVIADTYGTTKEAVIGPEGKGSAAVRLALGETQIVAQTRKYLEQEGVILDAFNNVGAKRSKTIILVKNLPSRTEGKEIMDIFKKHGEIGRIILPPSGITAIVEFLDPSEARKAFTKLAYSKFKNMPLYLEWAPENSLVAGRHKEIKEESDKPIEDVQESTVEQGVENEEDEDEEPEPDTTLFVKNLNFKTTDEGLRKHFEPCGKINYANVATKKDPSDPNNKLSMGYGFVRYMHKVGADKALKTLQQSVLDGKSLELKRSERTLKSEVKSTRKAVKSVKQTGTKILVRNVPFQATKKEIQELFSTFGEIKALRLPKKMDASSGSHRGFAFIDFTTGSEAKAAFEALSQSTHLYGRRLVLEWASSEEGVQEIRKRTADHFKPAEEVKSKKSVFNIE